MRDTARAILAATSGKTPVMIPVTILTDTPLTVNMRGTTITCRRVIGLTYTPGADAIALLTPPNMPIVLPIGD